jgi:hypothetical protein
MYKNQAIALYTNCGFAIMKNLCKTVHFLYINKLFNKLIELLIKGYHNLTITFFAKKDKIYNLFSIIFFRNVQQNVQKPSFALQNLQKTWFLLRKNLKNKFFYKSSIFCLFCLTLNLKPVFVKKSNNGSSVLYHKMFFVFYFLFIKNK